MLLLSPDLNEERLVHDEIDERRSHLERELLLMLENGGVRALDDLGLVDGRVVHDRVLTEYVLVDGAQRLAGVYLQGEADRLVQQVDFGITDGDVVLFRDRLALGVAWHRFHVDHAGLATLQIDHVSVGLERHHVRK